MDLLASKEDFEMVLDEHELITARLDALETTDENFNVMVKFVVEGFAFKKQFTIEITEKEGDLSVMPGFGENLYFVYEKEGSPYIASDELAQAVEEEIRNYFDHDVIISYGGDLGAGELPGVAR